MAGSAIGTLWGMLLLSLLPWVAAARQQAPADPAPSQAMGFTLDAKSAWAPTGLRVVAGDRLVFEVLDRPAWTNAQGSAWQGAGGWPGTTGFPDVVVAGAPLAALVGRIDGTAFDIGGGLAKPERGSAMLRVELAAAASGRLDLAMNDQPGTYGDNDGSLQVRIAVFARPVPMPDFAGQGIHIEAAARELESLGYRPSRAREASGLAAGRVLRQRPDAGADLRTAGPIALVYSTGVAETSEPVVPPGGGIVPDDGIARIPDVPERIDIPPRPQPGIRFDRDGIRFGGTVVSYVWPALGVLLLASVLVIRRIRRALWRRRLRAAWQLDDGEVEAPGGLAIDGPGWTVDSGIEEGAPAPAEPVPIAHVEELRDE